MIDLTPFLKKYRKTTRKFLTKTKLILILSFTGVLIFSKKSYLTRAKLLNNPQIAVCFTRSEEVYTNLINFNYSPLSSPLNHSPFATIDTNVIQRIGENTFPRLPKNAFLEKTSNQFVGVVAARLHLQNTFPNRGRYLIPTAQKSKTPAEVVQTTSDLKGELISDASKIQNSPQTTADLYDHQYNWEVNF